MIGRGTAGKYWVHVGGHDPFAPYQAQVVAYGNDNTRCKFYQPSVPDYEELGGALRGWYSRFFVLCLALNGTPVNSRFVFSFSGSPRPEDSSWAQPLAPPPRKTPKAAFLETTEDGTAIANHRRNPNSPYTPTAMAHSSVGYVPPGLSIRHEQTGIYRVILPGLGTKNPGLAQVTAVGGSDAHCVAGLPFRSSNDPSILEVVVQGWNERDRVDTGFILNYDEEVTRSTVAHQGARAYAGNQFAASYTPDRSYNTGQVSGFPGTNTAYHLGKGWYQMHHSEIFDTPNSVWVGASGIFPSYCKIEAWGSSASARGTDVYVRCFDAEGNPADTPYFETCQGTEIRSS
ncbi:hypothetical protein ACLMAJ_30050 [Nocardia sp. KC 131]|uniref:hypothetical protein n=1 Tax=Nocardia arseniciresistens TaxID=3392119 RepID=UPI00398F228C